MYFAYLDESGNPSKKDKSSEIYILVSILIHEEKWKSINRELKNLRREIWKDLMNETEPSDKFEIHLTEICNRKGYFSCLENNEILLFKILNKIYLKISTLDIKIISSIILKDEFDKMNYSNTINEWAFTLVVERLNRYIEHFYPVNSRQYVLLIMDSINKFEDNKRREQIQELMLCGTGHGWKEYPEYIIETPFFVSSRFHNGIQLADSIAYLLRRYVRKVLNINPDSYFNKYCVPLMKYISPLFDGYPILVNNIGIKIFPHKYSIKKEFWDVFNI